MKNKLHRFSFISIIIIITLFSGCDSIYSVFSEDPGPAVVYNEEDYTFDQYDGYDSSGDTLFITQEEALTDYYELWEILEENYPFFGVAKRLYSVDKDEVKFYYELIIKRFDPMPVYLFHYIMDNCLYEFYGIGHLNIIYPEEYLLYCDAYGDTGDGTNYFAIQNDVLHSEKVESVYGGMLAPDAKEKFDEYLASIEEGTLSNLEMKFLSKTTAYMKILSFEYSYAAVDYEKIMKFYQKLTGYKNLIIDLTENGGGSEAYWVDNIIAPNIEATLEATELSMAKKGNLNMRYFENLDLLSYEIPKSENANMQNLDRDDYNDMDAAFSWWAAIEPAGDKKMFDGKIYILMNENVYSASESFVMFCKKTKFATLVGKASGGDGGGIDPILASLPNSGLVFRFSPLYTINPDGSNNEEYGTEPDFFCNEGEEPIDACKRAVDEGFYVDYSDFEYNAS